jgi:hypothetical protein
MSTRKKQLKNYAKAARLKLIALPDSDMLSSLSHALDGLEKVIKENARELRKIKKAIKARKKGERDDAGRS